VKNPNEIVIISLEDAIEEAERSKATPLVLNAFNGRFGNKVRLIS
jgi:citrate lyase beta subunit